MPSLFSPPPNEHQELENVSKQIEHNPINVHTLKDNLKSRTFTHYSFCICFNDSPSKMMKNAFYLILKALFVLKILKLLSLLFGHVLQTARLER